jgi:hypothetical protein
MSLHDALTEQAEVIGGYLRSFEAAGFTRVEAFALVRDYHAALSWAALVSDVDAPPWLASPHASNPSSPSTGSGLRILKPPTLEP